MYIWIFYLQTKVNNHFLCSSSESFENIVKMCTKLAKMVISLCKQKIMYKFLMIVYSPVKK